MATIKFTHSGKEKEVPDNSPLEPSCQEEGLPFACSEGLCGTCIVEVDSNENLTEPTQAEIDFLGKEGVKKERMACQCSIKHGCVKLRF